MSMDNEFDPNPAAGVHPMSDDDPTLSCDWCITYPHSLPRSDDNRSAPPAAVAVAVNDCCTGAVQDYVLCEQHWLMLRDQPLPGQCPHCGAVADHLDDIVTTAMIVRDGLAQTLLDRGETVTVPAPAVASTTAGVVPTAIRQPAGVAGPTIDPTAESASYPGTAAITPSPQASDHASSRARGIADPNYVGVAEQIWTERRRDEIDSEYDAASSEIAEVARRLVGARSFGDVALAAQLDRDVATLTYQRDQTAYFADDAFKRDWHTYTMWRQTDHGHYFLGWLNRAFALIMWTAAINDAWDDAWNAALATIEEPERTAHARGQWIERTRRARLLRWVRDAAVVLALIGVVAALILGPAWWALPVAGIAAAAYAAWSGRDTAWSHDNAAAGRAAHDRRVDRFGFDPLEHPERPAPGFAQGDTDEVVSYAAQLHEIAMSGFETHPAPVALPEPQWPALADPDSLTVGELRAVLRAHRI
ncbi:MAG: hypothetical protein INR66_06690 [Gordonia polyisoprenivorans]|nr:hypothetical protein [Gordonia polyisoprenivorans]